MDDRAVPTAPPPSYNEAATADYLETGGMPIPEFGLSTKAELGFSNKSVRAAFVRKVFALVVIMFGIVCGVTAIPFIFDPVMQFVNDHPLVMYISIGVFIATYMPIACIRPLRRTYPWNLLTALILTLAASYFIMAISAYSGLEIALIAVGVTFVSCFITILFACQSKYDFTTGVGCAVFAFMVLLVATTVALVCGLVLDVRWLYVGIASAVAVILMVYLAVDVQLILGGKRFQISPEDYIYAAIQLFVDIIFIFVIILLIVLMIAGGGKGSCSGSNNSDCNCVGCYAPI
ncbi:Uncharacterized protein family UPF0005 containing protein, partial [Aphelenchoides avenae]